MSDPGKDVNVTGDMVDQPKTDQHSLDYLAPSTSVPEMSDSGKDVDDTFGGDTCNIFIEDRSGQMELDLMKKLDADQTKYSNLVAMETYDAVIKHNDQTNTPSPVKKIFSCDICKLDFGSEKSLEQHNIQKHFDISMKNRERKFECEICGKKYTLKQTLTIHLQSHSGKKIKCEYCSKTFTTRKGLRNHVKSHLNKREYKCCICDKRYNTASILHRHKKVVHTNYEDRLLICKTCKRRFTTPRSLKRHIQHHATKPFLCLTKTQAVYEKMLFLGQKPPTCQVCQKKFLYASSLSFHMLTHTNVVKCTYCNAEFDTKLLLDNHLRRQHPKMNRNYCNKCGRLCENVEELQKHLAVHQYTERYNETQAGQLQAEVCPETGKMKLMGDVQLKSNIIIIGKNDIANDHKVSQVKKDQYKVIEKKGRFECNLCYRVLFTKDGLEKHLDKHEREGYALKNRPFLCQYCAKRFSERSHLTAHMTIVHGDKTNRLHFDEMVCEICGKHYQSNYGYRWHMKIKHLEEYKQKLKSMRKERKIAQIKKVIRDRNKSSTTCELCGQYYKIRSSFLHHIEMAHGSAFQKKDNSFQSRKVHQCVNCKRKFVSRSGLNKHLQVTCPEVPDNFKCSDCSMKFKSLIALKRHQRKQHAKAKNTKVDVNKYVIRQLKKKLTERRNKMRKKQKKTNMSDEEYRNGCIFKEISGKEQITDLEILNSFEGNVPKNNGKENLNEDEIFSSAEFDYTSSQDVSIIPEKSAIRLDDNPEEMSMFICGSDLQYTDDELLSMHVKKGKLNEKNGFDFVIVSNDEQKSTNLNMLNTSVKKKTKSLHRNVSKHLEIGNMSKPIDEEEESVDVGKISEYFEAENISKSLNAGNVSEPLDVQSVAKPLEHSDLGKMSNFSEPLTVGNVSEQLELGQKSEPLHLGKGSEPLHVGMVMNMSEDLHLKIEPELLEVGNVSEHCHNPKSTGMTGKMRNVRNLTKVQKSIMRTDTNNRYEEKLRHITHDHQYAIETTYKCHICAVDMVDEKKYIEHFVTIHENKQCLPYCCTLCMKYFASEDEFETHTNAIHRDDEDWDDKRPLTCAVCNKFYRTFDTMAKLVNHIRVWHKFSLFTERADFSKDQREATGENESWEISKNVENCKKNNLKEIQCKKLKNDKNSCGLEICNSKGFASRKELIHMAKKLFASHEELIHYVNKVRKYENCDLEVDNGIARHAYTGDENKEKQGQKGFQSTTACMSYNYDNPKAKTCQTKTIDDENMRLYNTNDETSFPLVKIENVEEDFLYTNKEQKNYLGENDESEGSMDQMWSQEVDIPEEDFGGNTNIAHNGGGLMTFKSQNERLKHFNINGLRFCLPMVKIENVGEHGKGNAEDISSSILSVGTVRQSHDIDSTDHKQQYYDSAPELSIMDVKIEPAEHGNYDPVVESHMKMSPENSNQDFCGDKRNENFDLSKVKIEASDKEYYLETPNSVNYGDHQIQNEIASNSLEMSDNSTYADVFPFGQVKPMFILKNFHRDRNSYLTSHNFIDNIRTQSLQEKSVTLPVSACIPAVPAENDKSNLNDKVKFNLKDLITEEITKQIFQKKKNTGEYLMKLNKGMMGKVESTAKVDEDNRKKEVVHQYNWKYDKESQQSHPENLRVVKTYDITPNKTIYETETSDQPLRRSSRIRQKYLTPSEETKTNKKTISKTSSNEFIRDRKCNGAKSTVLGSYKVHLESQTSQPVVNIQVKPTSIKYPQKNSETCTLLKCECGKIFTSKYSLDQHINTMH